MSLLYVYSARELWREWMVHCLGYALAKKRRLHIRIRQNDALHKVHIRAKQRMPSCAPAPCPLAVITVSNRAPSLPNAHRGACRRKFPSRSTLPTTLRPHQRRNFKAHCRRTALATPPRTSHSRTWREGKAKSLKKLSLKHHL